MLSEEIKDALAESLNQKTITVSNVEFTPVSIRSGEFVNQRNLHKTPYSNPAISNPENAPRVTIDFPITMPGKRVLSDIAAYDSDTHVATFANGELTDVEIRVTAKEKLAGAVRIHQRKLTEAIMQKVESVVKKEWPFILADYDASIDMRYAFNHRDLTRLVEADGRSERVLRLRIRHQSSWDLLQEGETELYKDSIQIIYNLNDGEDSIVYEEQGE